MSFFALRDAAQDPALAWGSGHAWLFPIGVDMALVFFEVLLLGASMVRVTDHDRVVQYPRAIPFLLMLVAAAGTLYFNATHVPEQVRPLALAVPVASILVTLGLAYLLKMLAAASGAAAIHLAPPDPGAQPHRPRRRRAPRRARPRPPGPRRPELFPPHPVYGQVPSWAPSQHGQNGQPAVAGDGELPEATKRHQVEAYLAALDPDQLGRLTTLGPRAAARELTGTLNGQGMQVSERYVQQILDDWTAATRPADQRATPHPLTRRWGRGAHIDDNRPCRLVAAGAHGAAANLQCLGRARRGRHRGPLVQPAARAPGPPARARGGGLPMTGLGEAALAYAAAGYQVFPLRGKLPFGNCPACEPRSPRYRPHQAPECRSRAVPWAVCGDQRPWPGGALVGEMAPGQHRRPGPGQPAGGRCRPAPRRPRAAGRARARARTAAADPGQRLGPR